jgi:hypothetical protein
MMEEITPAMAQAILGAPGERILLPLQNEHFHIAGMETKPLTKLIDEAILYARELLNAAQQLTLLRSARPAANFAS